MINLTRVVEGGGPNTEAGSVRRCAPSALAQMETKSSVLLVQQLVFSRLEKKSKKSKQSMYVGTDFGFGFLVRNSEDKQNPTAL